MNRAFYLKTLSIASGTWLLLGFCNAESFGQAKNQGSGNANGESSSGETVALPRFAVIDLGAGFYPWGLNNKGVVIGGNSTSAAQVWKSGNFTTLQGVSAYAAGINDHGNIVGSTTGPINYTGEDLTFDVVQTELATYWGSETATPVMLGHELDEINYDGSRHHHGTTMWSDSSAVGSRANQISNSGEVGGVVYGELAKHVLQSRLELYMDNLNFYGAKFSVGKKPVSLMGSVSGSVAWSGPILVSDGHWGGSFSIAKPDSTYLTFSFIDGKEIALGWVSAINDDGIGVGLTESVIPPRLPIRSATMSDGTVLGPGVAYDINNRKIKDVDGKEISQPEIVGEDNSGNAMLWHHLTSDGKVSPKNIASNLNQLSIGEEWHLKYANCINDIGMITAIARKKSTNVDHGILLLPVEIKIAKSQSNDTDYLSEEKEESEGVYIPINADNDNGSPIIMVSGHSTRFPTIHDFDAANLDRDDDELVHMKVEVPTGLGSSFSGKLVVAENGRAKIKIWKDRKKTQLFKLDEWVSFPNLPQSLYVEGVKEGAEEREIDLKLLIKVGAVTAEGDAVKITVTPILKNFVASAKRAQPVVFSETSGNLRIVSGPGDSNIKVTSFIKDRNMPGQPHTIQTVKMESPSNIAAKLFEVSEPEVPIQTWAFDFKTPHQGKTLVDSFSEDNPVYSNYNTFYESGLVRHEIIDNPAFSFNQVSGALSQFTDIDVTWLFDDYAVWTFSDGSLYALGKTNWSVRWKVRFSRVSNNPLVYTWGELSPLCSNNTATSFTRDNTRPEIYIPTAIDALNSGNGGFQ